ncbi:hypothetical protein [Actinacidiphila sp. ITFR-21]|uniref:hypothetical protein n=1 Tax=Actinacidiphila sp. ITFR-21 TaxID=3075199 RepID=UPI00288AE138|nr:hypothetical protein [Streptomyces sp. ITFR-21]WNI18094.1 hypothetical protein RLT57_22800 [Streptomyces sp. ITFR-21]
MATMFAGVDWADRWMDCAVIRRDGTRLGHRRIVYAETAGVPSRPRSGMTATCSPRTSPTTA